MATTRSAGGGNGLDDGEKPSFLWPGIRCGLEMALAGGLVLLVGLPAENVVFFGAVVVLALVTMVVVLFWALNRQMERWMTAALAAQRSRRQGRVLQGPDEL